MDKKFSWQNLINPLYWVAFVIWLGKQARKNTYHGLFPGLITIPLGFAFSIAALITTKALVGDTYGLGWYAWLPACAVSGLVVEAFLWPFAYVIADKLGDLLGHVTGGIAKHVFPPIAKNIRHLPGSTSLWNKVDDGKEGKSSRKWFTTLLFSASALLSLLASGYLGYLFSVEAKAVLAGTVLGSGVIGAVLGNGWILAGFAGFVVARLVFQPLYDTLDKGEMSGLTVGVSALVAYAVTTLTAATLLGTVGIAAATFVAFAAWGFPLTLLFFNEGLVRFAEFVKPLAKKFYDAEGNDFRLFFHHTVNIIVAAGLAVGAYLVGTNLGWLNWITYGFTAITLFSSYLGVIYTIKHRGGNGIIGFLTSVGAGFATASLYGAHLGYFGWLGASIAGIIGAGAWGLVLAPALYRLAEISFGALFTTAGSGLNKANEAIHGQVKRLYKAVFEAAQEATFHDKTDFKPLFGQVSNLVFAVGVFAAGYAYGVPAATSTIGHWLALGGTSLLALISYLVGGKLAKRDGGEPLIALLCVGAALYVGGNAFTLIPWAWYLALPAAIAIGTIAGYALALFVIPPVYATVKFLVNAIPDSDSKGWKYWFAKALELLNDKVFAVVDLVIWGPLQKAVRAIAEFMAPKVVWITRTVRAITDKIDAMFNRKSAN